MEKKEDTSVKDVVTEEKITPVVVEPVIDKPIINEVVVPVSETKSAEEIVQKTKVLKQKRPIVDKFALAFIIIGFIAMGIAFIPLVSALFLALYYIILMCIAILTLLTLLLNEDFRKLLDGGQDVANAIGAVLPYCPYIFGGAIGFFVTSLILYCFSKKKARKIAGIVLNSLFIIVSVAGIILITSIN